MEGIKHTNTQRSFMLITSVIKTKKVEMVRAFGVTRFLVTLFDFVDNKRGTHCIYQ